jgi:hypothetical protein
MVYSSGVSKNRLGKHRFGSLFDEAVSAQITFPQAGHEQVVRLAKTRPADLTQRDGSRYPFPL